MEKIEDYKPNKGLTDKEWLEAFPTEMAEMIKEKKSELSRDIEKLNQDINESVEKTIAYPDDINIWLTEGYWVEAWGEKRLDKLRSSLHYFQALERQLSPNKQGITNSDIDQARRFPLDSLLSELKNAGGNRMKCCCPFHEEKTPSFIYYVNTNSWYCFGSCARGGDVIDFIISKEGLSFVDAIRFLT